MSCDYRYRRVHLDFHTSPHIPDVASDFDEQEFVETLLAAHVNAVTCFARCHHGYLYYQTDAHPERVHPQLVCKDLLERQIQVCRENGICVAVYTTVQVDDFTARQRRDWLAVEPDGQIMGHKPFRPGFYSVLDILHPGYRQFMRDHLADLFACLPRFDGVFLDIVQPRDSVAPHWIESMDRRGFDPENPEDRYQHCLEVIDEWKLETSQHIRGLPQYTPDCTIFYNGGHVGPRHRKTLAAYTHYELESLPSGVWGYTHFPMTMRHAEGLSPSHPCLGMTGKFHSSWGDFGSYKNRAALEFECFQMLSLNAMCSIGDQLPPRGRLDPFTYDLIGGVYACVEQKEPWCVGAKGVREIAVLSPEQFLGQAGSFFADDPAGFKPMNGLVRMLQELHLQFDIIDPDRILAGYRLLILPDLVPVGEPLREKIEEYLDRGGRILATHHAGLNLETSQFGSDRLGVEFVAEAPWTPDYLRPCEGFDCALPPTGHVMYRRGAQVSARPGATVLAEIEAPHFNRTWRHFCSHLHTPSSEITAYPGIVECPTGHCIYFAHPVFTQYDDNAPLWCKKLVSAAIHRLIGRPLVETDGPSTLLANLNEQIHEQRYVLHLLHYIPERRGKSFDVIEDVIPLHDVTLTLSLPKQAIEARLVPDDVLLPLALDGDRQQVKCPRLEGHAMIELRYR
jgi:hypothetical protein